MVAVLDLRPPSPNPQGALTFRRKKTVPLFSRNGAPRERIRRRVGAKPLYELLSTIRRQRRLALGQEHEFGVRIRSSWWPAIRAVKVGKFPTLAASRKGCWIGVDPAAIDRRQPVQDLAHVDRGEPSGKFREASGKAERP
jgi:hypothetical protein